MATVGILGHADARLANIQLGKPSVVPINPVRARARTRVTRQGAISKVIAASARARSR